MSDLPADLRRALTYAIARGYHGDVLAEITPLLAAALAEAWQDGYEAGHADARCVQASYPLETPNPYAAVERSGWEDHAPADDGGVDVDVIHPAIGAALGKRCTRCGEVLGPRSIVTSLTVTVNCPAAPSGVAPADDPGVWNGGH